MIKSSDIMELLKDKNSDLTKEELKRIIEEELLKDEKEMDADLIEMCLDALKEKEEIKKPQSKKHFTFRIAAYVAAAAVLVFVITAILPDLSNLNERNKIDMETESSKVVTKNSTTESATTPSTTPNLSTTKSEGFDNTPTETKPAPLLKGETTKPPKSDVKGTTFTAEENIQIALRKELKINGFENIVLPKIIFENPQIMNKKFQESKAEITIKSKEKIYDITIEKPSGNFEKENTIDVNGINVSVESENNSAEIRYRKNNLNYRIVFVADYEEAVKVAKTIC